jgi:hypothetical protein
MAVTGPEAIGREFVAALAQRDWVRVEACLAPDVQFRAVVPNEARPFRDKADARGVVDQLRKWFDDADPLVLVDSDVRMIADRLSVRYRFTGHEKDGDFVVEQQGVCRDERGKTRLDPSRLLRVPDACVGVIVLT